MDHQAGMRLYGFWRSIASFRVRVALRLKELPFEETSVDILSGEQFGPAYKDVNAGRVVPTLVHNGHTISQSLAIIEYLEEVSPSLPLIPVGARERAHARSLALVTIADAHPLVTPRVRNHLANALQADGVAIEEWAKHWTREGLATYQRLLSSYPPAPFTFGRAPGLADICIAGHVVSAQFLKLDMHDFPAVARLADHCFQIPDFSISHPFEQPGYRVVDQ